MALTIPERYALIEASGLFDRAYYLLQNGDVAASIHDPFNHYVWWGSDENRAPSEKFDPYYYVAQCAVEGFEPGNCLLHYLTEGRAAGLFATPLEHALHGAGMRALDLVQRFESWGRDCEFGLVQRRLGAEPNDLFRFSNPTPDVLVKLINNDFAGYGDRGYVALDKQQPRREWYFGDHETGTSRHSHIYEGDLPQDKVEKMARVWARLLREKTVREIATGQKIYVIKTSRGDFTEQAVAEVARALRSKGPSWLLWVEAGNPVGHCDVAMEGLIRARIDRVCERGLEHKFSLVGWLKVLCGAWNTYLNLLPADSPQR
jgi:hypothetical protein